MFSVIKRNSTLGVKDIYHVLLDQGADLDDYASETLSYTGYARFALYNILKLLKLERGSEVLLPAYICDVVLLPLVDLGLEPIYYGVTSQFQIDFGTIRLSPKSKVIIAVNYFGMSQAYEAIRLFSHEHQLIFINDNSHGFASRHDERKLESFGDFSITSFRKVLPTINGARARINNDSFKYLGLTLRELNHPDATERRMLRFFGATLLGNLHCRPWKHPDYSEMSMLSKANIMPFRLDPISGRTLCVIAENYVQMRRFHLYQSVDAFLMQQCYSFLELMPNLLHSGNSPMAYPVVVNNRSYWRAILQASRDAGVDIHTWPDLPKEVIATNLFGAVEMWQRLIFLPIHQDIEAEEYCLRLAEIFDSVKI